MLRAISLLKFVLIVSLEQQSTDSVLKKIVTCGGPRLSSADRSMEQFQAERVPEEARGA